mmetsp:Transcript_95931/g.271217  ORF Transcript_95931/g.271217 Transcript_95931/m.271217 type:complete len:388 (-) Transcript_95931:115-1278(-)
MIVGRMCMRQAGMTVAARSTARASFVSEGLMRRSRASIVSAMLSTAVSKAFSQEKPMSTAMALITERAAVSTSWPVESRSATLSRRKIKARATAVTNRFRTISFSMPASSVKKWPAMNQSEEKKTHQAKVIATMFFSCAPMEPRPYLRYRIRRSSSAAKKKPRARSIRVCRRVWLPGTASSPSGVGMTPPTRNRRLCTRTKDPARPTTSSSVSAVSSSHMVSFSSLTPSPMTATVSRMRSVSLPSVKITAQENGNTNNVHRNVLGTCDWRTAKALIAANPVMCPSRMPPLRRFSFVLPLSPGAFLLRLPQRHAPARSASTACRIRNQSRKCEQLTTSSNHSETPCSNHASTMPFTAWKSSTAEKIEIVLLMTSQEFCRSSGSFWLTR